MLFLEVKDSRPEPNHNEVSSSIDVAKDFLDFEYAKLFLLHVKRRATEHIDFRKWLGCPLRAKVKLLSEHKVAFLLKALGRGHGLNDKKDELALFGEDVAVMHPAFSISFLTHIKLV
jgi:hypothetical protein